MLGEQRLPHLPEVVETHGAPHGHAVVFIEHHFGRDVAVRRDGMPQLYSGSTLDFLEQTTQNLIAETLRAAFVDLQGFNPSDAEVRSWRNSLRALANALRRDGFTDHGILLEYQLPLSSLRLDALITGLDREGRQRAVIVELKQWDHAESSPVPECVGVRYAGRIRDQLHPSAQAGQYRQYLAHTHRVPPRRRRPVGVRVPARLRVRRPVRAAGARHANVLGIYPLFPGDRVDDLVEWLDDRLGGGAGMPVLRQVREGSYRPHKRLLDHTATMIRGEPAYVLLRSAQCHVPATMDRHPRPRPFNGRDSERDDNQAHDCDMVANPFIHMDTRVVTVSC